MIDIDDFKRINDTLGHLEGDRALTGVAGLFSAGAQFSTCVQITGGEEFVIVMPGASAATARQIAERIRRRAEEHSREASVPTTVSIGIGVWTPRQSAKNCGGGGWSAARGESRRSNQCESPPEPTPPAVVTGSVVGARRRRQDPQPAMRSGFRR